MVFAAREAIDTLRGVAELRVEPLSRRDARALLDSVLPARLDERVLERIVAETRGNPLALLPRDARQLLLVAAADATGDAALLWRAARRLGIPETAAATVESGGLLLLDGSVVFRHPLVRSAVYGAAEPNERRTVHRALAEETDPEADPDRRAWHLAQSASAPDEGVAAELERSAERAQARGGFAAAAAFLERAAAL